MTDHIPTEVRCPHCQGVIPPVWILNVCPECGRGVSLEELRRTRRTAGAVEDAPTEEPPPSSEAVTMTSVASWSGEAPGQFIAAVPFDTRPHLDADVTPPVVRPCVHHPKVESAQFCPTCGKAYCEDCLVTFRGRKICGGCKDAEVTALQRQGRAQAPLTGLVLSIVGAAGGAMCCMLCTCSIAGLVVGYQSLRDVQEDKLPRSARPTALAAITVGWVGVALLALQSIYSVLYLIALGVSIGNN
ncbi:MAG: DUF4190 domain-containing protein [Abditibacteriales bacterium]|nr:DUF4190 domain-containing protein [Abditibacteriales bacterium]MDW8364339.1 DUF4190 domain-containing protein [Abditibacteriales bacterium]